ncbi:hypothetical protein L873DRAFT_1708235, partial [Choiromyces venosus 120613-1]
ILSFLATPPPRTQTSTLSPLPLGGRYTCAFPNPPKGPRIASRQFLPPYKGVDTTFGTPPYHYHLRQWETFTVESGKVLVTIESKRHLLAPGESITVQVGEYHNFRNASDSEDLQILIEFPRVEGRDAAMMEEKFFRNYYSYAIDARSGGKGEPSPWQMMLFMWDAEMFLAFPIKGLPRTLQKAISWVVVFVGGVVIGDWLLGYKRTYPEYYEEPGKIEKVLETDDGVKAGKNY